MARRTHHGEHGYQPATVVAQPKSKEPANMTKRERSTFTARGGGARATLGFIVVIASCSSDLGAPSYAGPVSGAGGTSSGSLTGSGTTASNAASSTTAATPTTTTS